MAKALGGAVSDDLVPRRTPVPGFSGPLGGVPAIVASAGEDAVRRFLEFFGDPIRNPYTRMAHLPAVGGFRTWCEDRGIHELRRIEPLLVAAYLEPGRGARERACGPRRDASRAGEGERYSGVVD